MIVNDLSPQVNQVRVISYYFSLMLLLVFPQIKTSVLFVFNLRVNNNIPGDTRIFFLIKRVSEDLNKFKIF